MAQNHLGRLLFVAQGVPATNDAAGFEALTWVQVKGNEGYPTPGKTHAENSANNLSTGEAEFSKGIASFRETTFGMIEPATGADAGQTLCETIADDDQGLGSVMVVDPSGAVDADGYRAPVTGDAVTYMQGIFRSFEPNEASESSHRGASVTFRQNKQKVEATYP